MTGELYVVGGAAMALAYDERRATRDVDAVFEPKLVVYEAAQEIARRLGLTSAGGVLEVAEDVYGGGLDAAARFFVEELFPVSGGVHRQAVDESQAGE